MLYRIAILAAALMVGSVGMATDALARGGGGGSRGGLGGGHFGGMGERHFGGGPVRQHYGHYRGWRTPYGYYGGDSGYYDPSTVAPDEQSTYPTPALSPREGRPHSSCSTQTYKVPSERGGEASIDVVRC
jgi:hypothetical protein